RARAHARDRHLSAIGWSKRRIMGALVIEGFILSALGSVLGILIGVAGSRLLSAVPAIGPLYRR
ncbi:MAG: FtsX-like permease family protein, partial [Methyloceanibacter sp.]